jgi:TPR repeat protein
MNFCEKSNLSYCQHILVNPYWWVEKCIKEPRIFNVYNQVMKRSMLRFVTLLLICICPQWFNVHAQGIDKEYEKGVKKLDKEHTKLEDKAIKELQQGVPAPAIALVQRYIISNPYASLSKYGYDNPLHQMDRQRTAAFVTRVQAEVRNSSAFVFERAYDSISLERAKKLYNDSWRDVYMERFGILYRLIQKNYSGEVFHVMADIFKNGKPAYSATGDELMKRNPPDFDSVYYYTQAAAVRGWVLACQDLADIKMFGNGNWLKKPTSVSYKYIDTASAKIWYKITAEKNPYAATYRAGSPYNYWWDSISDHHLLQLTETNDTLVGTGIAYFNRQDYRKAYEYWLAAAKFQNNSAAFYNIGVLTVNGFGVPKHHYSAVQYFEKAGDLGMAKGYYMAGYYELTQGSTVTEYPRLFRLAANMGYAPAKEALEYVAKRDAAAAKRAYERELSASASKWNSMFSINDYNTNKPKATTPSSTRSRTTTCSMCNGRGTIHTTIPGGAKNRAGYTVYGETSTCLSCNGRGYN